nr:unnamed protein product [Leishmania braziliensis]
MSSLSASFPAAEPLPATRATSHDAFYSAVVSSSGPTSTHLLPPPQGNSRSSGNDAHACLLMREQQHMIEQLTSTGLVQVADLLEFGFSPAELCAAGLHLPSPHHRAGEQTKGGGGAAQAEEIVNDSHEDCRRPRRAPRKRAWPDCAAQMRPQTNDRATPSPAAREVSTAALLTVAKPGEPKTAAKGVMTPTLLSENTRAQSLRTAKLVEQTQHLRQRRGAQDCARWLCYDDADDEEASSTTPTGASSGEATAAVTSTAHKPAKTCCNTALDFSGLDVAVVKEIAQRLQEESSHDAYVESCRMRDYFESREDGNTPYM